MNANPILLQMKYTRVVSLFAKLEGLSLYDALTFFYESEQYPLISKGISDMHCMSDQYNILQKNCRRSIKRKNREIGKLRQYEGGYTDYSLRKQAEGALEEKMDRWMYLEELAARIKIVPKPEVKSCQNRK